MHALANTSKIHAGYGESDRQASTKCQLNHSLTSMKLGQRLSNWARFKQFYNSSALRANIHGMYNLRASTVSRSSFALKEVVDGKTA